MPYYHVVFTLPAGIAEIAYHNKAAIYGILFKTAAETLITIAATPGISVWIWMASPVCGFHPSRAGRAATLKMPSPKTRTASPATRASRMAFTTAVTARPAAVWFSSVA